MQGKGVAEAAVVREQRKLMDRVEGNLRTLTAARRLLRAQVQMWVHDCSRSGDGSELAGWTNEVQRPNDWANRSKHRPVKGEVKQTIVSLFETGPGGTVILLRRF